MAGVEGWAGLSGATVALGRGNVRAPPSAPCAVPAGAACTTARGAGPRGEPARVVRCGTKRSMEDPACKQRRRPRATRSSATPWRVYGPNDPPAGAATTAPQKRSSQRNRGRVGEYFGSAALPPSREDEADAEKGARKKLDRLTRPCVCPSRRTRCACSRRSSPGRAAVGRPGPGPPRPPRRVLATLLGVWGNAQARTSAPRPNICRLTDDQRFDTRARRTLIDGARSCGLRRELRSAASSSRRLQDDAALLPEPV